MRLLAIALLITGIAAAAEPENFHFEVTVSGWHKSVRGHLQAGGLPVDLHSDLALDDAWTLFGRASVKAGRRNRFFVEGAPYRFDGDNALSRAIVYAGETYTINEEIASHSELDYLDAGYQFDVISQEGGHLGLNVSGAYLHALGTITAADLGISGVKAKTIGLPLAGIEGRVFFPPRWKFFFLEGDVKGMALGGYGHFVQGGAYIGAGSGHVAIRTGYQVLDADVHEKNDGSGIQPHISGFVIGLQLQM